MKFKNLPILAFLLFTFLWTSCEKESQPGTEEPKPEEPEVTVDTTLVSGAFSEQLLEDFSTSSIQIIGTESAVNLAEDGSFSIENVKYDNEAMPVMISINENPYFGYFPEMDTDSIINAEDILFFYMTIHPEMVIQGFSKETIKENLYNIAEFDDLCNMIMASLVANEGPLDNEQFVSAFSSAAYDLAETLKLAHKSANTAAGTYKFNYERTGKVTWDKEFPSFAYLGLEIQDAAGNVYKTTMLDNKSLVLTPGSLKNWVFDQLFSKPEDEVDNFTFSTDGTYKMIVSNGVDGVGSPDFESDVDFKNRMELAAQIISTVVPFGLKQWLKDDCKVSMTTLFTNQLVEPLRTIGNGGESFALDKSLKSLKDDVFSTMKDCNLTKQQVTFTSAIKALTQKLSMAEDVSTLIFFIRDYLWSDLTIEETRYFYDGISFGELDYINLTDLTYFNENGKIEFLGEKDSKYTYSARVQETVFNYDIDRDVSSSVTPKQEKELAIGIPFELTPGSEGDATINSAKTLLETRVDGTKVIETSMDGTLEAEFKMGEEDTEFTLKPAFKNSNITEETILLTSDTNPLIGEWNVLVDEEGETFPSSWFYHEAMCGQNLITTKMGRTIKAHLIIDETRISPKSWLEINDLVIENCMTVDTIKSIEVEYAGAGDIMEYWYEGNNVFKVKWDDDGTQDDYGRMEYVEQGDAASLIFTEYYGQSNETWVWVIEKFTEE